jgi:hypothetical protein
MIRSTLLVVASLLSLPTLVHAQADEPAAVRAVVDGFFDAMRAADSTAFRAALDPRARLVSSHERDGQPVLEVMESLDGFVAAVGTPRAQVWDERIWDVDVRIDDRLAVLWARYAFYVDDALSHCGVDVFQLHKGPDGWRIFEIADTRRREECGEPPGR